jgi:hypothetical protein
MHSSISLPHSSDDNLREFVLAVVAVEIFLLLFFRERKVYDISSAALVAWLLGLLARHKFLAFYLVYPFACLNRETTFLLTLMFAHHFSTWYRPQWIYGATYQLVVFVVIRIALMLHFASAPGSAFLFQPIENLQLFAEHPLASWIHWSIIAAVIYFSLRDWRSKPILLRSAFTVLAPSLLVLYLFLGVSFEVRVFAEVYPVAFALGTWRWLA